MPRTGRKTIRCRVRVSRRRQAASAVTIHRLSLAYADHFTVLASDETVSEFCYWDRHGGDADALADVFINAVLVRRPWTWSVCMDGQPVGVISLTVFTGDERCNAEIHYVLSRRHWGRGIMPAAMRMAVGSIFREKGLEGVERVQAWVHGDNKRSQRVVEKAGFSKEAVFRKYCIQDGTIKDMISYSFLDTDLTNGTNQTLSHNAMHVCTEQQVQHGDIDMHIARTGTIALRRLPRAASAGHSVDQAGDDTVAQFLGSDGSHANARVPVIKEIRWAVLMAGVAVGAVILRIGNYKGERRRASITFALSRQFRGRGIMPVAVRMLALALVTHDKGVERVEALVDVENVSAQRVVEKAGFCTEGVLRKYCLENGKSRDVIVYSFLETDIPAGIQLPRISICRQR